jgi:two-component system nitrogen regulation response regulator NtrX
LRRDTVVVIDDDARLRAVIADVLADEYDVVQASMVKTGRLRVEQGCDCALLDVRFGIDPGNQDGLGLLEEITAACPGVPVVIMTGHADMDVALRALKAGAADFIQKETLDPRQLPTVVSRAIQRSRDQRRTELLESRLQSLESTELIGSSTAIREVREQIGAVAADGRVTSLIVGETGTGKELAARMIHRHGLRRRGPFVTVNIPGLGLDSIERELFGLDGGDARNARPGLLEQGDGGVLFLDGVAELPVALQGRLLRVLEGGTFQRCGSVTDRNVDVQIVASSTVDLRACVDVGSFRQDLFYRLRGFEIRMPTLRDCAADVQALAEACLHELRLRGRSRMQGFSEAAMESLRSYGYPGNVRELRSIVERAVIVGESRGRRRIEPVDLPDELRMGGRILAIAALRWSGESAIDLDRELAVVEAQAIEVALSRCGGRKHAAGDLLGLSHRHALPRRVARILRDHPDAIAACPKVSSAFAAAHREQENP